MAHRLSDARLACVVGAAPVLALLVAGVPAWRGSRVTPSPALRDG